MKSFTLIAALAATVAQSYIIPPQAENVDVHSEDKRQILGTLTSMLGKGGKVADPPGAGPKKVALQTDSKVAGAKRIKIRSGPYSVPNMNKTSLVGEAGMLWNYPDTAIIKPCTECTIVRQYAGLEYPDGRNANIDTGMWLHHMVQIAIGPGRADPTCYGRSSLPHIDVGASPQNSERYFSSGNERTHILLDILGTQTKWGYHVKSTDRFAFIVDLMNMNMEDKTVYLTMTYDIVEGALPAGWEDVKVVWFDAAQCGTSEVRPPQQSGSFTIKTAQWKPNFEGRLLGVGGHIHDGGVDVDIMYGPGQKFCNSAAAYAESKEYITFGGQVRDAGPSGGHSHMDGVAKNHISSMTTCYTPNIPITHLKKDQVWTITAKYDYNKFQGNKENGKQQELMAIALMYVAIPAGGVTLDGGAAGGGKGAPRGGKGQVAAPKGIPAAKSAPTAPKSAAPAQAPAAGGHAHGA